MTFPLEIDAGFIGHLALHPFVRHPVEPAVLDEVGAGFDEAEGHVIIHALLTKRLDPCEIAGPGTVIVLPAALDPLDLPGGQPGSEAHRADEGGAHDALMLEGQLQQKGDTLVRPTLVFTGDIASFYPFLCPFSTFSSLLPLPVYLLAVNSNIIGVASKNYLKKGLYKLGFLRYNMIKFE